MKMGHVGSLHSTLDSSFFFAMLFCITTGIDIYWKVKMGSLCTRRSVHTDYYLHTILLGYIRGKRPNPQTTNISSAHFMLFM
jgi:hypothetical protein